MARDIKFRGKASGHLYNGDELLHKKGDWLYGDLIHQDGRCFICEPDKRFPLGTNFMSFAVEPETVGQFTELTDKNGVEIYEGDFIAHDGIEDSTLCIIIFVDGAFGYVISFMHSFVPLSHMESIWGQNKTQWVVQGNIHDNPELLTKTTER